MNLTTDDVWDEREKLGLNKPSRPNPRYVVKKIVDNNGIVIYEGNQIQRKSFLKKHFNLTERWTKRGRLNIILKYNNYTLV